MAGDNIDSNKDIPSSKVRPTSSVLTSPNNALEHTSYNTCTQDTIAHSPLEQFQWLIGIHTPSCLTHSSAAGTRGDNIGLYQRSKDEERRSRIAYVLTSFISNTLFLLQIMLAAAFTGLSAYKEASPVTLTILGAFNTVVAGCLAWQKGQGVPQRYRKAQDQYQALILEIEMTERSFIDLEGASGSESGTSGGSSSTNNGLKLVPHTEQARLQKLYDIARADQQANYPDLYVSTGAAGAKASGELTKELEDAKAEAAKVQGELLAKIEALAQKLEGKVGEHVGGVVDDVLKK